VFFQREFEDGECGEDDKGDNGIIIDTYGGWESRLARAGVPYLCSSTRMAPGRARYRQGDKKILKIVKEKNNFRPGMITDKLDLEA